MSCFENIEVEVKEVWKDVVGWEGLYEISSYGRLKSLERTISWWHPHGWTAFRTWPETILKYKIGSTGYWTYHIRDAETSRESWPSAHQLVAQAFIPNPENKPTVNHIDCNKENNNISNLEWATSKEQAIHAYQNNRMNEETRGFSKFSHEEKQKVKDYYDTNDISINNLAAMFNMSPKTASSITKGKWGDARHPTQEMKDKAISLRAEGKTLREIGEILNKSFSSIHKWVGNLSKEETT